MSTTPHSDDRIARLEAQREAIDAAFAAFAGGVEEYQVGTVRYRRANMADLQANLARIEANLSRLYALKLGGGRTFLARGRG